MRVAPFLAHQYVYGHFVAVVLILSFFAARAGCRLDSTTHTNRGGCNRYPSMQRQLAGRASPCRLPGNVAAPRAVSVKFSALSSIARSVDRSTRLCGTTRKFCGRASSVEEALPENLRVIGKFWGGSELIRRKGTGRDRVGHQEPLPILTGQVHGKTLKLLFLFPRSNTSVFCRVFGHPYCCASKTPRLVPFRRMSLEPPQKRVHVIIM